MPYPTSYTDPREQPIATMFRLRGMLDVLMRRCAMAATLSRRCSCFPPHPTSWLFLKSYCGRMGRVAVRRHSSGACALGARILVVSRRVGGEKHPFVQPDQGGHISNGGRGAEMGKVLDVGHMRGVVRAVCSRPNTAPPAAGIQPVGPRPVSIRSHTSPFQRRAVCASLCRLPPHPPHGAARAEARWPRDRERDRARTWPMATAEGAAMDWMDALLPPHLASLKALCLGGDPWNVVASEVRIDIVAKR